MLNGPVHHVLAVQLAVADLAGAASFFLGELGFERREESAGAIELSNGALTLRLQRAATPAAGNLELEVMTGDIDASRASLCRLPGVEALAPMVEVERGRIEQRLTTPFGAVLILTRKLTVDELGDFLPVPTELEWEGRAVTLVQRVLRHVPLEFRAGAHARAARAAEALALLAGEVVVGERLALEGLLASTPEFKQESLSAELVRLGFDPGAAR